MTMDVAIIGAGPAGLAAAGRLHRARFAPVVFDKGRGPGGRTVSKRTEQGAVDLGAQFFTARDPHFREVVAGWQQSGVVVEWAVSPAVLPGGEDAGGGPRYLAVPRMSALARHLAAGLDLRTEVRVDQLQREGDRWRLRSGAGHDLGLFHRLVIALPAPQAEGLLAPSLPGLAARAREAPMAPCWAVAVALDSPLAALPDAAFVNAGALGWIARSGSRPQRHHPKECWALHAGPGWSREHLEEAPEAVTDALVAALGDLAGEKPAVLMQQAHRWRYARALHPLHRTADPPAEAGVVLAGDWVGDGRIEGAWLSGEAAADAISSCPPSGRSTVDPVR